MNLHPVDGAIGQSTVSEAHISYIFTFVNNINHQKKIICSLRTLLNCCLNFIRFSYKTIIAGKCKYLCPEDGSFIKAVYTDVKSSLWSILINF